MHFICSGNEQIVPMVPSPTGCVFAKDFVNVTIASINLDLRKAPFCAHEFDTE